MATVERILDLIQSNNITAAKLTQEANLTNGLITQWKKGLQKPSTDALVKIADYFEVSLDYLLGRTNDCSVKVNTVTDNHGIIGHNHAPVTIINGSERKLSEQEVALINLFEKLDVLKKAQLLTYAAKLTEEGS